LEPEGLHGVFPQPRREDSSHPQALLCLGGSPHQQHGHHAVQRQVSDELEASTNHFSWAPAPTGYTKLPPIRPMNARRTARILYPPIGDRGRGIGTTRPIASTPPPGRLQ